MNHVERAAKQLLGYAPEKLSDWAPALARVLFALALYRFVDLDQWYSFKSAPHPNGPAEYIDVPLLGQHLGAVLATFYVMLVLYAAGVALPLSTGVLATIAVLGGSLKNSQGAIGHSHQVMSLLLVVQALAYAWPYVRRKVEPRRAGDELALSFSAQAIAYVYVCSGISKLRRSGLGWIEDSPNIFSDIMKTHGQNYYNQLEPGLLERGQWWASAVVENATLSRIALGAGLFLELFAFLALVNRGWGLIVGLSLSGLHAGVKMMMGLNFEANQYCIVIFLCSGPYWALVAVERFRQRTGGAGGAAPPPTQVTDPQA